MTAGASDGRHWHGVRGDAFWQVLERATRLGLGFLVSVIMARALGPETFGTYSYALSFVALFAFLGQAGLDSLLQRELVRNPADSLRILGDSLALRAIGAGVGGLLSVGAAVAASWGQPDSVTLLVLILSLSSLAQSGWVVESWLQTNRQFRAAALAKIAAYVLATVLRLLALERRNPLEALAMVTVLESAACAVLLWRAADRNLSLSWRLIRLPAAANLRELAAMAAPMLLSSLTIAVYSRIDVFMLGRLAGGTATGLYSSATLLSEGFYLFPAAAMAAAAPRLSALYLRDDAEFKAALARLLRLLSAAGLAVALLMTLSAPIVVPLLYGPAYAGAAGILQIHVWSTWMVFVSSASDPWYINHDLRRLYLTKTALAATMNVVLNLLFIPRWQGYGAALATAISYSFSAVGFGLLLPTTRPLATMQLRAMIGLGQRNEPPQASK